MFYTFVWLLCQGHWEENNFVKKATQFQNDNDTHYQVLVHSKISKFPIINYLYCIYFIFVCFWKNILWISFCLNLLFFFFSIIIINSYFSCFLIAYFLGHLFNLHVYHAVNICKMCDIPTHSTLNFCNEKPM